MITSESSKVFGIPSRGQRQLSCAPNTIDSERRLASNSALRRKRNTDYLKIEDSTNNKNNKTSLFNVAFEDKIFWLICKEAGHTTAKYFYFSKAEEAVLNK